VARSRVEFTFILYAILRMQDAIKVGEKKLVHLKPKVRTCICCLCIYIYIYIYIYMACVQDI